MSLILEALRKSEAERRRGQAPDLRVELPPPPAPRRRGVAPWAWTAGIACAVVLVLLLSWFRAGGDRELADGHAGTATPAEREPLARGPGDDATAEPGAPARDSAAAEPWPRVERIDPPPPVAAASASAPGDGVPRTSAAASAPPVDASAPATVPLPAGPPRPPADAARRLATLSAADRGRLPEAKLSMHMWNSDPARRFVIIDGQRRVEGDRLGEAVITAIDRDGVLLELDGRALRIPLP